MIQDDLFCDKSAFKSVKSSTSSSTVRSRRHLERLGPEGKFKNFSIFGGLSRPLTYHLNLIYSHIEIQSYHLKILKRQK